MFYTAPSVLANSGDELTSKRTCSKRTRSHPACRMLLVTFSLSGAYRGYKDLMRPLLASTVATLVKMMMDFLFLVVYQMGVKGAAWSDVV